MSSCFSKGKLSNIIGHMIGENIFCHIKHQFITDVTSGYTLYFNKIYILVEIKAKK